ncbi:MAG TPA: hypothetical protein VMA36_08845 [Candidatus Limnocylindria bacterium]|jgi:hypothetical protein|nr:hypothetical protein [Candidatus Limnocylindria bacterium]
MLGELFLRHGPPDPRRKTPRLAEDVRLGVEPQAPLANEAMELSARCDSLRLDDRCHGGSELAHEDHAIFVQAKRRLIDGSNA